MEERVRSFGGDCQSDSRILRCPRRWWNSSRQEEEEENFISGQTDGRTDRQAMMKVFGEY